MNVGIISSRYAHTLLEYSTKCGECDTVLAQSEAILYSINNVPQLEKVLRDPTGVTVEQKMSLLRTTLGNEKMAPSLEKFLHLVIHNERADLLGMILFIFGKLYYRSRKVRFAVVTTAIDLPDEKLEKIRLTLSKLLDCQIEAESRTDPSIIGGMTITIDDYLIDASVASQLSEVRRQYSEKITRIV